MTCSPSGYSLRDYQEELIQGVFAAWNAGHRRLMIQLATGAGKTVVFSALAHEFTSRGEGVLVLAHLRELLTQAQEKLEAVTGEPVGIIRSGCRATPSALIQVASVQTLIRRDPSIWPKVGLVIVDEAHHSSAASYIEILAHYPAAYILGVSATPARSDGRGFTQSYDAMVLGWSVRRLIESGYLCPFRLFAAKRRIKASGIKIARGDYDSRELAELVNTSLLLGDVIQSWQRHALGKKTIVFTVNVAHSKAVVEAYCQEGYAAEHLDGETPPQERAAIMERFRAGETVILSNCGIFSEGVDVPGIHAVQILRPTRSLNLHLQQLGRGLRPSAGKEYLIILDHTENWIFHGLPDEEHEWALDAVSLKNRKWAIECPDCHHCFTPSSSDQNNLEATCPSCGVVIQLEAPGEGYSVEQREITNDKEALLEEVDIDSDPLILADLQRLKEMQEKLGYKPMWIYFQLIRQYPEVGLPELRECAKLCGFKSGWAWYRWQQLQSQEDQSA